MLLFLVSVVGTMWFLVPGRVTLQILAVFVLCSLVSGVLVKDKESGKEICFSRKWFMDIVASQALTAACLAAAIKELAQVLGKQAAAHTSVVIDSFFLEGVCGAAAALMYVATSDGSVFASFKLLFLFFEGAVAALVSVAVVVTAAAFLLLCAATVAADAFGTVVVREFAYGLTDGGCMQMSVTVASSSFAGVLTLLGFFVFLVFVCLYFAGRQPASEGSQQQAAAAGRGGSLCL